MLSFSFEHVYLAISVRFFFVPFLSVMLDLELIQNRTPAVPLDASADPLSRLLSVCEMLPWVHLTFQLTTVEEQRGGNV
jgi:hypothetical protein